MSDETTTPPPEETVAAASEQPEPPKPEVAAVPADGVIRDSAGNAIRHLRPDEVARANGLARKA